MTTKTLNRGHANIKHIGNRPKDDQDNLCREKLCHLVRDVGCFYELCEEKLYLVYLAKDEDPQLFCDNNKDANCPFIFWTLQDNPKISYEPFNMDFGPFNLATTHQFCSKLKVWLDTQSFRDPDKYIVIVLDDEDTKGKLNTTLLVAIAAMVLLNLTDDEVIQRLSFFMMYKHKPGEPKKELVFRDKKKFSDVSGNPSLMSLTLEDCIKAFYAAMQLKFYEYYEFDHAEYLFYETVVSGDLNWIIPGKVLAFAGPCDVPGRMTLKWPPRFYYDYFRDHNVTTIVRLNEAEYKSSDFQNAGFDHHDLIFPDGYPPTSTIATKFIKIVDEARGAVAVHCYAGIGRTGTLIAAYLMARYGFTPQMAVAWTRICRPGSVIGDQQDWLFTKFDRISIKKSHSIPVKQRKTNPTLVDISAKEVESSPQQNAKTAYAVAEKTYGQAKALLLAKKQRDRPCTRNSHSLKNAYECGTSKNLHAKGQADVILNLGKTVPLMLNLADFKRLKQGKVLKFYHIQDGKYEWKVKFPEPSYVKFKHSPRKDIQTAQKFVLQLNRIFREPRLDFENEKDEAPEGIEDLDASPKLRPIVYLSCLI